jgi:hypothetical protein
VLKGQSTSDDAEQLILSSGHIEKLVDEMAHQIGQLGTIYSQMAENESDGWPRAYSSSGPTTL